MSNHRETIKSLSTPGMYKNSRVYDVGGIPFTAREVLIAAPVIACLNEYLVGGTGEGKTQLANDLAGFFGANYCYAEGRPDFEPSEILKQLNLGGLKDAASDKDLVSLTENVHKALYYVDELNRCPPIIQNYFFNFFDGKLVHNGRIHRLGNDGYAVGFASGNLGDGAYVGTEDSDRALKDRMHLIVKLDDTDYCTTPEDDWVIFGGKKDPRASISVKRSEDITPKILLLHKDFGKRAVPVILQALGIFFHKGLDYLENTRRHSKRAVDMVWPNVQGIKQDTDESKIMPFSKRAVLSAIGLTEALTMIAEGKEGVEIDQVSLFLDALRFTAPYSGVFAPQYVHNEKDGDVYAAFDDVMEGIKKDITDKKESLETAIAFAQFGVKEEPVLDVICASREGRWAPVRQAIESVADNPLQEPTTLESIKEEYTKTA